MGFTIHLDATYATGNQPTGVANYGREIIRGLASAYPDDYYCLCYRPQRFLAGTEDALPPNAWRALLVDGISPWRPRLFHGLNQRLPRGRMKRAVSTFHDLFVMSSEYSTLAFRQRFTEQAKDAAARSDLVICVSAFTASQVESLLHVPRERIRVVHHGVRLPPAEEVPPPDAREPLVLFVGAIQKRKNVAALVRAFATLPKPWKLALVGHRGYGWEEVEVAVAESPVRDRIAMPGYLDDASLRSLYARASVFAFPTLDEGFGMPVLEAMGWGLPVLSSCRSSIPEVAGDAALLIDPLKEADIADALRQLADHAHVRAAMAARGRAHAACCTWERAVQQTHAVYEELLA